MSESPDQRGAGLRRPARGDLIQYLACLSILACLHAGCGHPLRDGDASGSAATGPEAGRGADRSAADGVRLQEDSVFTRRLQQLTVEFRVHRYSAPQGTFTGESGLWKLVTGPLPEAASALCLGDNGFRAAIGLESDRAPLRDFLGQIDGLQSAVDDAQPDPTRSVELELGACSPRLVVFYFGRAGGLRGLDFQDAKAKLQLRFELRSVNLKEVRLEVVPVLEEPPGELKWVMTEDGAKQVPEERRQVFTDLTFAAQIPEGGFLLMGAGAGVYDRPLLARPFFTQGAGKVGGGPAEVRESIYVISPIVRAYDEAARDKGGKGG